MSGSDVSILNSRLSVAHAAHGHVGQLGHGLAHVGDVVRLVLGEQHLHARAAGEVDIQQFLAASQRPPPGRRR